MTLLNDDPHTIFGIDEVYIQKSFDLNLLGKLQQRAALSLDSEETVVQNNVSCDMILVFHKRVQNKSMIYRFLKFLNQYAEKEDFIRSNTLLNEEELFEAIKSKKFVLVTQKTLAKDTYSPTLN